MLKARNHEAGKLTTHGFLIGVEVEEGTAIENLMNHLVDSLTYIEGVGRVDAEHIGEMGDYDSIEQEVLAALTPHNDEGIKES